MLRVISSTGLRSDFAPKGAGWEGYHGNFTFHVRPCSDCDQDVWLVGGFAASPWLFEQLKSRLAAHGLTVYSPDTNKFVHVSIKAKVMLNYHSQIQSRRQWRHFLPPGSVCKGQSCKVFHWCRTLYDIRPVEFRARRASSKGKYIGDIPVRLKGNWPKVPMLHCTGNLHSN